MFPKQLQDILEKYYEIQEKSSKKALTPSQKKGLVKELISEYNNLVYTDKIDVLVPAKWEFLEERCIGRDIVSSKKIRYVIFYRWPPNNGFDGTTSSITLKRGKVYDRLGSSHGFFLSPVPRVGSVASVLDRAIPYYIPEKDITQNPAYHRYEVVYPSGQKPYLTAQCGKTAHAFWCNPDDGGGIQIKMPQRIKFLVGGMLIENW